MFRSSLTALALGLVLTAPVQAHDLHHALGKALFDRLWTSAPASTDATDGLGPLFNARSCATCHPRSGRGAFTEEADGRIVGPALLARIGDETGQGDPVYGVQLQTNAVQGLTIEGTLYRLPSGGLEVKNMAYGPFAEGTRVGGRLAPDLHGLGWLEAVPAKAIEALADPEDQDGDGISGRPNYSYNATGERVLSRFGWKAGKATVLMQSAAAANTDVGLSNPIYPHHAGDCTASQALCMEAPHGGSPRFENLEINGQMLGMIASFVATLHPPLNEPDPEGEALFVETGCAACHAPSLPLVTGKTIKPYTDLLLHDMGDALADGIGDAEATGREWRTTPLWGLSGVKRFLHDGRAKSITEAIDLHGGEAHKAREAFFALPEDKKTLLLRFVETR